MLSCGARISNVQHHKTKVPNTPPPFTPRAGRRAEQRDRAGRENSEVQPCACHRLRLHFSTGDGGAEAGCPVSRDLSPSLFNSEGCHPVM